jgi:hypothetical protein
VKVKQEEVLIFEVGGAPFASSLGTENHDYITMGRCISV